jgi:molybdopterin synthase catalytic subunit
VDTILRSLKTKETGAILTFLGIVRGKTEDRTIEHIEVQSYKEMAEKQLAKIRKEALEKFGVNQISIIHKIGTITVSDSIVLIAVGGAHRDETFKACRFVLEQLKKSVPIWKKEFTSDGTFWIDGETP